MLELKILLLIFFAAGLWMALLYMADYIRRHFAFACRLDWHPDPETATWRGINCVGKCPRCGREIMQDSHGNWFSAH